jgi:hypothetical protein
MHSYEASFANSVPGFPMYYELDLESTHWGVNGAGYLAAFLNNIGGWRQSCFTGFMNNLVSEGKTYRTFSYDELNGHMVGEVPFRNPSLGSTDFPTIVVSGGVATYTVEESFWQVWSQSAGTGSWVKVAGAVTNTCLNGWFPVTGITSIAGLFTTTSTSFTTPSSCANGTYTESAAQLYHYYANSNPGGVENATTLPRLVGTTNCCNSASNSQNWDSTYFQQVVVSGCNGTTCSATVTANSHGIANGQGVRFWGSSQLLNTVAAVVSSTTNTFTITYYALNGTLPANGTYTSSNDANLFFTVDLNVTPSPFLTLRNIFTGITGNPATTWAAIGLTYDSITDPGIVQWEGKSAFADASWLYIPQSPIAVLGGDATAWQWMTYSNSTSGRYSYGYQLSGPRSMLWNGVSDYVPQCVGTGFNPGCDRPQYIFNRPEGKAAQMMGMHELGVSSLRMYGAGFLTSLIPIQGLGWNWKGTGRDEGISPFVNTRGWHAMAETQALIATTTDTYLQPPCNKPAFDTRYFSTDCHTSATYGNQLAMTCSAEMPYGPITATLNPISNGSTILYTLDGYSTRVSLVSGNPSSVTKEFCPSPGFTSIYISQPASYNALTTQVFAPPATLPFGAAKYLIRSGYVPEDQLSDSIVDCTFGCQITVDNHSSPVWIQTIYANANGVPVGPFNPPSVALPGRGLP